MKLAKNLLLVAFGAMFAAACSSSSDTTGTGATGGTGGSTGGSGGSTGGSGGSTGGSGGSTGGTGGTGGSTGGSSGSGGSTDGGTTGGSGGGGPSDAASDGGPAAPSMGNVVCGSTTCPAPAQVCCSGNTQGPDAAGGNVCGAPGTCGHDIYTCSGQANCPSGTVCCVTLGGGGQGIDLAQCQFTCGTGGTQTGDSAQVCQPGDVCPAGTTCQTGIGGYTEPVCAP